MNNEFNGIKFSSIAMPWVPVGHPQYVWRPAADCDVQRTWRNYGWKPLDEQSTTTKPEKFTPIEVLR